MHPGGLKGSQTGVGDGHHGLGDTETSSREESRRSQTRYQPIVRVVCVSATPRAQTLCLDQRKEQWKLTGQVCPTVLQSKD